MFYIVKVLIVVYVLSILVYYLYLSLFFFYFFSENITDILKPRKKVGNNVKSYFLLFFTEIMCKFC